MSLQAVPGQPAFSLTNYSKYRAEADIAFLIKGPLLCQRLRLGILEGKLYIFSSFGKRNCVECVSVSVLFKVHLRLWVGLVIWSLWLRLSSPAAGRTANHNIKVLPPI